VTDAATANFFRRRVRDPIVAQLTQGVTPHHLALSCALGVTLGLFPILGSTTLLCFLAGLFLKLNQPAIQTVNYVVYPFQIAMFPVFIRAGERLWGAAPIAFSPLKLTAEFAQGPGAFMSKYGAAGAYGISVWMIAAPVLIAMLYFPLAAAFRKITVVKQGTNAN
jgi:uncharacterized protein (DUF2062 family)